MQSELKRLTRSERTHRLCTRAGMLEIFLKEPTVLTDEDVMEPLTFIFQSEAVQKKLNLLIESRRETQEADEGENGYLIISINDSEDVLTIKNFNSELFAFEFADGIIGTVNADTAEFTQTILED